MNNLNKKDQRFTLYYSKGMREQLDVVKNKSQPHSSQNAWMNTLIEEGLKAHILKEDGHDEALSQKVRCSYCEEWFLALATGE